MKKGDELFSHALPLLAALPRAMQRWNLVHLFFLVEWGRQVWLISRACNYNLVALLP